MSTFSTPSRSTTELSHARAAELRISLLRHFFTWLTPETAATPTAQHDINNHVFGRYQECAQAIIPWVGRRTRLASARVLEIGCGTGSSTAAFAERCRRVDGYDIDTRCVAPARDRLRIMGIDNAAVHLVQAHELLERVREDAAGGVDVVLYYAVLEHQTIAERLDSLRLCWEILRPGGVLVVTDTPNRLAYWDHHTALLPFFHMLPDELAVLYGARSPRGDFAHDMRRFAAESMGAAVDSLARWGRGASYHEFELALGDLNELVVGDGWDPEILGIKDVCLEDELLRRLFIERNIKVPLGFARTNLDLILRKP